MLVDAEIGGTPRKLVVMANRNGFFYVLDRKTGEFLLGRAVREADVGEGARREAAGRF